MIKCLFAGLFIFFLPVTPKDYFGDSYAEAKAFCCDNKYLITDQLSSNNIKSEQAISIVFPELIRYSRLSNLAETSALEVLYVKGGTSECDFSIGRFQMKPSFIEELEKNIASNHTLKNKYYKLSSYPDISIEDIRTIRVERLKSVRWQLDYLSCFFDICKIRWKAMYENNIVQFLRLSSAAYNLSINSTEKELLSLAEQKNWPYGKLVAGRFSYPDVAIYFFENDSKLIFK
jgi:hypothetical protein